MPRFRYFPLILRHSPTWVHFV